MSEMINIDGSQGEGGGQVLRSSLALSVCLGKPFQIINIRAKRKKPGLLRQHLTAVQAAARISNALVEGDFLGSQSLSFEPNTVQSGEYHFSIGTAGSVNLVLQTIMIPLLFAESASRVVVEGGTHNPLAPPFEFLQQAYLPILEKMGAEITLHLERPGFFPRGGGCMVIDVQPLVKLKPFSITDRGPVLSSKGIVYLAGLPLDIAEREARVLAKKLKMSVKDIEIKPYGNEFGPLNMIMVSVNSRYVNEVFTAYGQKGVRAEIVAKRLVSDVQKYIDSETVADEHLTDQLLLPMALAGGGEFTANCLSSHTETNIDVIQTFLEIKVSIDKLSDQRFHIKLH